MLKVVHWSDLLTMQSDICSKNQGGIVIFWLFCAPLINKSGNTLMFFPKKSNLFADV